MLIRDNYLVRSNLPKELSNMAINDLLDNGITTIIDLRNDEEIFYKPGVFWEMICLIIIMLK